jgi:hypothetical protein
MAYGGSEFTSAFGGIADMAGFAAGSTRSRLDPKRTQAAASGKGALRPLADVEAASKGAAPEQKIVR